jgi:hypothetical protein
MKTQSTSLLLTVLLAIAMLGLATAVIPALAQNPVPLTARQAAALPAFAKRLHPPVTAQAGSKSAASARTRTREPWPQDNVIYENGPVNALPMPGPSTSATSSAIASR